MSERSRSNRKLLALDPIAKESLNLGESTVHFDQSMQMFAEFTKVRFPEVRAALRAVHQTSLEFGIQNEPVHVYVTLTDRQLPESFQCGVTEELRQGLLRVNRVIFCHPILFTSGMLNCGCAR